MDKRGKQLLIATLVLELPGVWARGALASLALLPLLLLGAVGARLAGGLASIFAWGPLLISIATALFLPGGALWTRFALGAREPSRRERASVDAALAAVMKQAPAGTRLSDRWYVVDMPTLNASVIGTTLYLNRELIRDPHLAAVLAHELGHLTGSDARLTLALRRLVLPPVYWLSRLTGQAAPGVAQIGMASGESTSGCLAAGAFLALSFVLALAGGGLGLILLNPLWVWYWRQCEYAADAYAARCGQAAPLAEYLEDHQGFDVAVPYFLAEHPYTELRIDRLLLAIEQEHMPPGGDELDVLIVAPVGTAESLVAADID